MNKRFNTTAQGGFTLIELIVVIVILGILAATALPRFTNLSGDARFASLNAVRGSVNSVVAMAHGRALLNANNTAVVNFEGTNLTLVNGYPPAAQATFTAAGLNMPGDYTFFGPGSGNATTPTTSATQIAVVPTSIAGTATAAACFVRYTESTGVNVAPLVEVIGSAENCL